MGLDHQLFRDVVRERAFNDGCGIHSVVAVAKVLKAWLKKLEPIISGITYTSSSVWRYTKKIHRGAWQNYSYMFVAVM